MLELLGLAVLAALVGTSNRVRKTGSFRMPFIETFLDQITPKSRSYQHQQPSPPSYSYNSSPSYNYNPTPTYTKPAVPTTLYHGTSANAAEEIYRTGQFMIGQSKPSAVWMTSDISFAKNYSKNNGRIVEIAVDPSIRLTNKGNNVYIKEIPNAAPFQNYYKVSGLKPINTIDPITYTRIH